MPIKHDLYLFVPPAPGVTSEIQWYRERPALVRTPVADDRLHTTIGALGRFDATPYALIAYVEQLLSGVTLPSYRMMVDRLVAGRTSALLQPSERLSGFEHLQRILADLLRDAVAFLGIDTRAWQRHIKPHVTLGYCGRASPAQAIEPISWTADRLLLVESLHGAGKHVLHASWPLTRARQLGFDFDGRR